MLAKAVEAWRRGDGNAAEQLARELLERDGSHLDAHRLLVEIWSAGNRIAEAIGAVQRVIELVPRDAAAHRRLGELLNRAGDNARAVTVLEASLRLEPDNVRALNNLGLALTQAGDTKRAVEVLLQAVRREPAHASAWVNLGVAQLTSDDAVQALVSYEHALQIPGALTNAHRSRALAGRAQALLALGRAQDAMAAFDDAVSFAPADLQLRMTNGLLMLRLGVGRGALAEFDAVLQSDPGHTGALEGRAMALMALGHYDDARRAFQQLREVAPQTDYLAGYLFNLELRNGDWSRYETARMELVKALPGGQAIEIPLNLLAYADDPELQRCCAETYVARHYGMHADANLALPSSHRPESTRRRDARLSIGYLSYDYRNHPVAQLFAGILESHDRSKFVVSGFSTAANDGSALRQRLVAAFDHFDDISALGDSSAASLIARRPVDVLIDLGGHTLGNRGGVLAHRPAPVQVTFLGYPGTYGAPFVDYVVADRHVIPETERRHYSEQIIYLPDCYLPGGNPSLAPAPVTRAEVGLPAMGIVYCAFNAAHKYSPPVFDSWMRILQAVPGSVLWLRGGSDPLARNLRTEAIARGVDAERLIFAPWVTTTAQHLARLALADLFLDCMPYNAHSTAVEALSVGVPVVTLAGRSFASRVATSALHSINLGQLSASNALEYEHLAIDLAKAPLKLAAIKSQLQTDRANSPLFDTARMCRHLEDAFVEIAARQRRGETAQVLRVTARSK